jgi:hypothetical protein
VAIKMINAGDMGRIITQQCAWASPMCGGLPIGLWVFPIHVIL